MNHSDEISLHQLIERSNQQFDAMDRLCTEYKMMVEKLTAERNLLQTKVDYCELHHERWMLDTIRTSK